MADMQSMLKALEKRSTFKSGVDALCQAACRAPLSSSGSNRELDLLFPLVARVHALLKARHTNKDFWSSGLALFSTCQVGSNHDNMDMSYACCVPTYSLCQSLLLNPESVLFCFDSRIRPHSFGNSTFSSRQEICKNWSSMKRMPRNSYRKMRMRDLQMVLIPPLLWQISRCLTWCRADLLK